MGQITEDFARRMIENYRKGEHTPLTAWEECQLACAWLRANGLRPPESLDPPRVFTTTPVETCAATHSDYCEECGAEMEHKPTCSRGP